MNAFGTIHSNLMLPESTPSGQCRLNLHRPSTPTEPGLAFDAHFEVRPYQIEPIELSLTTDKTVYYRGENVAAKVKLQYYYGTPLKNEELVYSIGSNNETQSVMTGEDGLAEFEIPTKEFSESQAVSIQVRCPARNVTSAQLVYIATQGFSIKVSTGRRVYIAGETFEPEIQVIDPSGEGVETDLKLEVFEKTTSRVRGLNNGERLVESATVKSEASEGLARKTLSIQRGGTYLVRATAVDQFGNSISGESTVLISGDDDSTRLRILADQHHFNVGEEAKVRLHWRESPSLALVTYEGASVLDYKLVKLKRGENQLDIPLSADLAPNFFLSVVVMQRESLHQASSEFTVQQKLNVKLTASQQQLEPKQRLKVAIEVTDLDGNPTESEFTLALVKSGLVDRFGFRGQSITDAFGQRLRTRHIRHTSSCTFNYQAKTQSIEQTLLVESERRSRIMAESIAMDDLFDTDVGGIDNRVAIDLDGVSGLPATDASWDRPNAQPNALYAQQPQQQRGLQVLQQRHAVVAGDQIVGDFAVGQMPAFANTSNWSAFSRQRLEQNIEQAYTVQVPYTEQVMRNGQLVPVVRYRQETRRRRISQLDSTASQMSQLRSSGKSNVWTTGQQPLQGIDSVWLDRQGVTINGLTNDGKLVVLNGLNQNELDEMASGVGGRVLAGLSGTTGFWNPVVVTDASGRAEIEIIMPAESTAWSLTASGISEAAETGFAKTNIVTRKQLFGQLKTPRAFTEGDNAIVEAEIHQTIDGKQRVEVELAASMGEQTQRHRQTVELDGPSVKSVSFPIKIIDSDEVQFQLSVKSDDGKEDISVANARILPYGYTVYATASGTASQSTLAMVSLDKDQRSGGQSLEILVGGSVNQSLIESLLENDTVLPGYCRAGSLLQRNASDCMAGTALARHLRNATQDGSPNSVAINEIVSSAVSSLIAAQKDDGSWALGGQRSGSTDPMLTARIMWSLASARKSGFSVPPEQFSKGVTALKNQFGSERELDRQAILLLAMTQCGAGDFALANRLFRERNRLGALGLANLMLVLAEQNHPDMASQLAALIEEKRKSSSPMRLGTSVEVAAIELLALQKLDTQDNLRRKLAETLMSARAGTRWPIESDNGPATSALAAHFGEQPVGQNKVSMGVFVNGVHVQDVTLEPGDSSVRVKVPKDALVFEQQKIEFQLKGRGRFSYSAVLTGFAKADEIKSTTNDWSVRRRYEPDQIRFQGKPIARGHGVVRGGYSWTPNKLTELPVGQLGRVTLSPRIRYERSKPLRAYLMLVEPIPAGCTVLEESISGTFDRFEIADGSITFYIGDWRTPSDIRYSLVGYTTGQYRAAPPILRNFFSPAEIAVGEPKQLAVLPFGSESSDEYRLTPDEHFALGKANFENRDFAEAHQHLSTLLNTWQLDPAPYKESVTLLFQASMELDAHSETVRFFEIIKERFPDVELTFEQILNVAGAYREISEYERSYLVYRATLQGSFEKENQVAGFLNTRGEFLRSVQTIESLLRDYPAESYVATANYALAQEVYRRANTILEDDRLQEQGVTRVDLVNGSIRMLDDFITNWPDDPASDQACFALATALIDLEQYELAIKRGNQYSQRYPNSKLLDSFWYMIGFCYFEIQDHQKALEMCSKVADAQFKDPDTGIQRVSENKWEAIYIMGQVYHSLGEAAKAIDQYAKVSEKFKDAAEAIEFFTRKSIRLPDVSNFLPGDDIRLALEHRNLEEVYVKVYRIDLMKFGLTRRNLEQITAINLAGISPYHSATLDLGDGKDYRNRETQIALPLKEKGAYLVVCRGENQYASGLVLVSSLSLVVNEDVSSGRVRVSVKDESKDAFASDIHIKAIGSENERFTSGQTDLRGLFVADDIQGTSTIIAVSTDGEYAFHRGKLPLQPQEVSQVEAAASSEQVQESDPFAATKAKGNRPLLDNVFKTNSTFQLEQQGNIEGLMNNDRQGIQSKEAY